LGLILDINFIGDIGYQWEAVSFSAVCFDKTNNGSNYQNQPT
jgi:hypothetical protein